MPGKYPTINSTLTSRTTLTAGGTAGLSNSDKNSLNKMFPNSPIYNELASEYLAKAAALLQPSNQQGDADIFPTPVNLDYANSPDLLDKGSGPLKLGFDSPYYPNLIAAQDPAGAEGEATGTPLSPNDNFGSGNPVNVVVPSATSALISGQTIDVVGPVAPLGDAGAQSVNPGATGQTGAA